jgi:N-acetyl-alpha-D-muramate 1-phosphate uridylyltransferase
MSLAAVILAAGRGRRLAPLTDERPKVLCPVNNLALVDHALERVSSVVAALTPLTTAVNAQHLADQIESHLAGRVHVSVEAGVALGTAGALGKLRNWIDGRDVLVTNGDAWGTRDLTGLIAGWTGREPRLLVVADESDPDFDGRWRFAGSSLLPWSVVRELTPTPSGLYEIVWRAAEAAGRLSFMVSSDPFIDCGTPSDYLRANLAASGGHTVVGDGARLEGIAERCVLWPGAVVGAGERLVESIRTASGRTVAAPQPGE